MQIGNKRVDFMHQLCFIGFSNCILMLASAPAAEDNNATAADAPADGKHAQQNINTHKIVIVLQMVVK